MRNHPLVPTGKHLVFEWLCIAIVYSMFFWTGGNSGFIILLTAYWLFFEKKFFDVSSKRTQLMFLFCSLYLISLIGLLNTANMEIGLFRLQQKSAIFFFPIIFGTTILAERSFRIIKIHFVLACLLAAIISLIYGIVNFVRTGQSFRMTREGLMLFADLNPPMTGLLCIIAIIILLHHIRELSVRYRVTAMAIVAFLTIYMILLGVRLEVICLFVLLVFFIFRYIRSTVIRILLASGFVLATAISLLFIPALNRKWKELVDFSPQNTIVLDKDSSLGRSWGGKSIRLAIWQCSKDVIKRNWLTGVGTGDVQDSLQAAYAQRKFYFAAYHNKYNAHNEYLEMWLANGLPGLLIYVSCLVIPLLMFGGKASALDYTLFICLLLVMSFTETFLNVNKGVILYSFFNSIFGFAYFTTGVRPTSKRRSAL